MIRYWIYNAVFCFLLLFEGLQAQPPCSEYETANLRRTAIVIGEKTYKGGSLQHTFNDAADMRDSLKKIGFEVVTYLDADRRTLEDGINNWSKRLNQYDVALFYFSGHGAEVAGENFLFPIDADPQQISDLKFSCYSANEILERMDGSSVKYNIMLLDACRENPFLKRWEKGPTSNGGLSVMSGTGLFLGLAAQPGKVASDGSSQDRNGVYTTAILHNITTPNTDIDDIFTTINREVREKSSGGQIPHKQSTLSAKFCFSVAHQTYQLKNIPYIQSASQIMLTANQGELVTADSSTNEISVRDSRSLSILKQIRSSVKPYKLVGRSTERIYVIDSAAKKLSIIRYPELNEYSKIVLPGDPVSIAINMDETFAYIGCKDSARRGPIMEIDLKKMVIKTIGILPAPAQVILSSDAKRLYAIGNGFSHNYALYVFDTKTGKQIKQINGVAAGGAIAISPDNRFLYVSLDSSGRYLTNVIDLNDWSVKKQIDQQTLNVALTIDGKYALLSAARSVAILKTDVNEVVNNLILQTPPKGLAITDDNRALIWLPEERMPYSLDINANLKSDAPVTTDDIIKKFNSDMQRSYKEKLRFKLRPVFKAIYDSLVKTPAKIIKELSGEFQPNYSSLTLDSAGVNGYGWIAIQSTVDPNKIQFLDYTVQGSQSNVIISFKGRGKDDVNWIPFPSGLDSINWSQINKAIREYIAYRLPSTLSF